MAGVKIYKGSRRGLEGSVRARKEKEGTARKRSKKENGGREAEIL